MTAQLSAPFSFRIVALFFIAFYDISLLPLARYFVFLIYRGRVVASNCKTWCRATVSMSEKARLVKGHNYAANV